MALERVASVPERPVPRLVQRTLAALAGTQTVIALAPGLCGGGVRLAATTTCAPWRPRPVTSGRLGREALAQRDLAGLPALRLLLVLGGLGAAAVQLEVQRQRAHRLHAGCGDLGAGLAQVRGRVGGRDYVRGFAG